MEVFEEDGLGLRVPGCGGGGGTPSALVQMLISMVERSVAVWRSVVVEMGTPNLT